MPVHPATPPLQRSRQAHSPDPDAPITDADMAELRSAMTDTTDAVGELITAMRELEQASTSPTD